MTSPSPNRQAALFANVHSRRGRNWFRPSVATLEAAGLDLVDVQACRHFDELRGGVQRAISRKVPLVIVGGGDGTLSNLVRYFVGSESVLGVLPLGTGNQFARDLGIPVDIPGACKILLLGHPEPIDLGVVEDDYFINVSTVGLTTQIAEALTGNQKRSLGWLAYGVALVKGLAKMRHFDAIIRTPEGETRFRTLQVVVGNGRFHAGPFPLHPDAAITDGKLNCYAVIGTNPVGLLKLALHLPGGKHVHLQEVPTFSAEELTLETYPVKRVTVDGEIQFRTPVRFRVAPKAIRVMVPESFSREKR